MAQKIGYQDGIAGLVGFLSKFPLVKYRPMSQRPVSLEQWSWLEKIERTLRLLKDAHDAAIVESAPDPSPPPPLPPGPPPPTGPVAPRTYNEVAGGEPSARFCTAGLTRNANGRLHDIYSEYDDDGRDLGGRTSLHVIGLKPANEMDGRSPCDPYGSFPPWPPESYAR